MYILCDTINKKTKFENIMTKKLTKHGNSLALIIDKPLLDVLKISQKTDLEISIEGNALIIRPVQHTKQVDISDADIDEVAERILKKYKTTFKKLSDS